MQQNKTISKVPDTTWAPISDAINCLQAVPCTQYTCTSFPDLNDYISDIPPSYPKSDTQRPDPEEK